MLNKVHVLLVVLLTTVHVFAEAWVDQRGMEWHYCVAGGKATLGSNYGGTAIPTTTSGEIFVPAEVNGIPVVGIGNMAFYCCSLITTVSIPEGVQVVGDRAFSNCKQLSSVSVPSSVVSIGQYAFEDCSSLTQIAIPEGVVSIGDFAFNSCVALTRISFPASLQFVGQLSQFIGFCTALERIDVADGNATYKSVDGVLYNNSLTTLICCPYAKTSLSIPASVLYIKSSALCGVLSQIEVAELNPEFKVYGGALYNNAGASLFYCPDDIPVLKIPATVVSIDIEALDGIWTSGPGYIEVDAANPYYRSIDGVLYNKALTKMLYCPEGITQLEIPATVFSIGDPSSNMELASIHVAEGNPYFCSVDGVLYNKLMTTLVWCPYSKRSVVVPASVVNIDDASFFPYMNRRSIDFEGGPPGGMGLAVGRSANFTMRYNVAFSNEWAAVISAYQIENALPYSPEGGSGGGHGGETVAAISLCVTNVVVNYVLNSVRPEIALPISSDTEFVNIIAEVKGGGPVAIPSSWAENFAGFSERFGSDFSAALMKGTGKYGPDHVEMMVWQDYVAGTDPTKSNDVFTASVTMKDGKPLIGWSPELPREQAEKRKYTILGKHKLQDTNWKVVEDGRESDYNFYRVTVEMK